MSGKTWLSILLISSSLSWAQEPTAITDCSFQLNPNETLEDVLRADPIGQVQGKGVSRVRTLGAQIWFAVKHFKVMKAMRSLRDRSVIKGDSEADFARSAEILNVPEKNLKNYWSDALVLKEKMEGPLGGKALQSLGDELLKQSVVVKVNSRPEENEEGLPRLVLFSGPKCLWCDFVKPAYARLAKFVDDAEVYYTDSIEFGKAEGINFQPLLVAYGPQGRVVSQAYFSNTKKLWNRMLIMVELAAKIEGQGVLNKKGELLLTESQEEVEQWVLR